MRDRLIVAWRGREMYDRLAMALWHFEQCRGEMRPRHPRATVGWLETVGVIVLCCAMLTGCAVAWISPYDKESVARTTEISKVVLKYYQDLLAVEPSRRRTAVTSSTSSAEGDVETMIRLHLLKEQARTKNDDSVRIANNLLEAWQAFARNHRSADRTAFSDATLENERSTLERHLRAAFVAEEAKKLGLAGQ
jgi:hypothetical protein